MSRPLVWLHGDSLSPADPALRANPGAPAVFVFDEDLLARVGLTFKRLFFMYECAVEALTAHPGGGEVRRGRLPDEVLAYAREQRCDEIHVTVTDAPLFATYHAALARVVRVEVHEGTPLVRYDRRVRRFSQMWRAVEQEALSYSDPPTPVLDADTEAPPRQEPLFPDLA
jgi:hypothetical protein